MIISKLTCECIEDYIFHRTENFNGVEFKKSLCYRFHGPNTSYDNSRLVAVSSDGDNPAFVGMSIDTFNEHFVVILDSSDVDNINICKKYKINYRTKD